MYDVEYLKFYRGSELSNIFRYNAENSDISDFLKDRYCFRAKVKRPVRPSKKATREMWQNYEFQLTQYNKYAQEVKSEGKYVLDINGLFIITNVAHKFWINTITSKVVSPYSQELRDNPKKFIGYQLKDSNRLLICHYNKMYIANFDTQEIVPYSESLL